MSLQQTSKTSWPVLMVYAIIAIIMLSLVILFVSQLIESDIQLTVQALFSQLNAFLALGNNQTLNTLLLFVLLAIATSIGLPRQVAAFIAGANLGAAFGALIATFAATTGCALTFILSRYLLSRTIKRKYPEKISTLSAFIGKQTLIKTIVIRLLPIGSNLLTNIVAGVTTVSMARYVLGSCIGFVPQMLVFSYAGSGIRMGANNELFISAFLFILALLLSVFLYKKSRRKTATKI